MIKLELPFDEEKLMEEIKEWMDEQRSLKDTSKEEIEKYRCLSKTLEILETTKSLIEEVYKILLTFMAHSSKKKENL